MDYSNRLGWSNWNSTSIYLPREVHTDRAEAAKFTEFLLEWQRGLPSLIANANKLEEFLLTVGLVYRDLIAMNATNDLRDLLPDYMGPNSSVLSHRLMSVCDHVMQLTHEEIKRSVVHVDTVTVPSPNPDGVPGRKGKGRRKDTQKVDVIPVASFTTQNSQGESSGGLAPRAVISQESPIVLPKPRKRARGGGEVYDVDNDLVGYDLFFFGSQSILTLTFLL